MRVTGLASILASLTLAACGSSPDVDVSGSISAPQRFAFRNFTEVIVDAGGAPYVWRQYHLRDGSAFRLPYDELRVEVSGRAVHVTDAEAGNGGLMFDGVRRAGTRFHVRSDGTIDVLPP